MDLIRCAIKALFYDYPLEQLVDNLTVLHKHKEDTFLKTGTKLISFREHSFSLSELEALKNYIRHLSLQDDCLYSAYKESSESYSGLILLFKAANDLLTYRAGNFTVEFTKLFKWRSIVKDLGEDTLIIPYIAHKDIENRHNRKDFAWESVLGHNETHLNKLFDSGLCDIHSHLGASTEIVELNWINIMNDIKNVSVIASSKIKETKDYEPKINIGNNGAYSANYFYILAAAIRVYLYKTIIKNEREQREQREQIINIAKRHHDKVSLNIYKSKLQDEINTLRLNFVGSNHLHKLDYAIYSADAADSPYSIYIGERSLMYEYYKQLASGNKEAYKIYKYVLLYERIKIRFRKEFVQTNSIVGLANFSDYNERKSNLLGINLKRIKNKLAVQTSIRQLFPDALESRININDVDELCKYHTHRELQEFYGWSKKEDISKQLTFVAHVIKKADRAQKFPVLYTNRYDNIKKQLEYDIKKILHKKQRRLIPLLVGIDAAGQELNCRPEVFGHIFRYYQEVCNNNVTFHVGEDFYDLADGIRAVEESLIFCDMKNGSRLGHCLALGIDPKDYYNKRYRTAVIPKQILLDNLIWILVNIDKYNLVNIISSRTKLDITEAALELYNDIGYDKIGHLDVLSYYYSIYLRSDDDNIMHDRLDNWYKTSTCRHSYAIKGRNTSLSVRLHEQYKSNPDIKKKGDQTTIYKVPVNYEILISEIQSNIRKELSLLGITIECNPTSNLYIGHIERYEQHPIFKFKRLEAACDKTFSNDIIVTINTDDKGIFATSLANEFSLIALAIMKKKDSNGDNMYNRETMLKFVSEIIENNRNQRFIAK